MLGYSFYLAWRDYWHEWLLSLCAVLALVAVLSPLLVLGGVRNGIIAGLEEQLMSDPRNLELIPAGSGHYNREWFSRVAGYEGVGFLIAQTRSIAGNMDIYQPDTGQKETVELIPTAKGDPLLMRWQVELAGFNGLSTEQPVPVVLSSYAAQRLGAREGQVLQGRVGRINNGVKENAELGIVVMAILPLEAQQKMAAYVPLDFLVALEDYRDGREVRALGWPGEPKPDSDEVFASFRLYAKNLDAVEPLGKLISREFNIQITTRAEEISTVKTLDKAFAVVFWLISAAAIFGFAASVASQSLAAVKRKSRSLAILRLMGFPRWFMLVLPMWQSWLTGLLGFLLSCGLYWLVAVVINRLFAGMLPGGQDVCRLYAQHFLLAALATFALCALASVGAAWQSARIEPAEVIRDV